MWHLTRPQLQDPRQLAVCVPLCLVFMYFSKPQWMSHLPSRKNRHFHTDHSLSPEQNGVPCDWQGITVHLCSAAVGNEASLCTLTCRAEVGVRLYRQNWCRRYSSLAPSYCNTGVGFHHHHTSELGVTSYTKPPTDDFIHVHFHRGGRVRHLSTGVTIILSLSGFLQNCT